MCKLLIFGGTTEGRELAELCAEQEIDASVSVATEYGAELLPKSDYIHVLIGRLDEDEIADLIRANNFDIVVDATHPYAQLVTHNIKKACEICGVIYYRLLRAEESEPYGICVGSISEAKEYLEVSDKRALITTGSKELAAFASNERLIKRLAVRVLPAEGIIEYCERLGFERESIICEKGPFTVQQNIDHIRQSGAEIIVSKQSGSTGGYPEKAEAARLCGIDMITIVRPTEQGMSFDEIADIIKKQR